MSRASGPRTSPTTMRSGRIRSELRTRSRIVTCALALDVRRAGLEADDVRLLQLQLGRVLDRDDALVVGDERATARSSVVVLPAPVPPETMMLMRPRTQASRNLAVDELIVPNSTRSSAWYGSAENFRIVSGGPSIASGGIDRVDTRAVGQTGVHVRARLVDAAADLRRRSCRSCDAAAARRGTSCRSSSSLPARST